MRYTVREVAKLSGVTVKTLHHDHKIGLLTPCETTPAGYRLYGARELERLQHLVGVDGLTARPGSDAGNHRRLAVAPLSDHNNEGGLATYGGTAFADLRWV